MGNPPIRRNILWIIYLLPFVFIILLASHSGPDYDYKVFYVAGESVLHGSKPLLWNPPWVALFFVPLSLFPLQVSYLIYVCISIIGFSFALHRLGCTPINTITIILSALGFMIIGNGNIDWMVLLGAIIPAQYGLFLLVAKPQISVMLIVILLIKAFYQLYKKNPRPILQFIPVFIAIVLSFALDLWNTPNIGLLGNTLSSLFPIGIPMGLYLAYRSWKEERIDLALAASPFMVPYANPYSLVVWLIPLRENQRLLALASMFTWVLVIIRIKFG
jgi:hypothetical protein